MAKNEFELKVGNTNNMRSSITFPDSDGVIATINGIVRVRMFVRCSVDCIGDGQISIKSGQLTNILSANIADLTSGKLWLKDSSVKNAGLTNDLIVDFITSKDIVIENFANITSGKLIFNIWCEPLTLTGEIIV
jgi:hypothetical protein